jgi:transposase
LTARRRFSEEAKRRIVEEASRPGVSVTSVARRYKITTSLLFRWRQALGIEPAQTTATFLPVRVVEGEAPIEPAAPASPAAPTIVIEREMAGVEIQLVGGRRVLRRLRRRRTPLGGDRLPHRLGQA